ncbi:MAG: hypothetical protein CBB71_08415 [Rhodopirellula sp. TMED11]|nr:MAG: hypothetical protein CBB71_08415 [Rhodopirellula sp. TMED11]
MPLADPFAEPPKCCKPTRLSGSAARFAGRQTSDGTPLPRRRPAAKQSPEAFLLGVAPLRQSPGSTLIPRPFGIHPRRGALNRCHVRTKSADNQLALKAGSRVRYRQVTATRPLPTFE